MLGTVGRFGSRFTLSHRLRGSPEGRVKMANSTSSMLATEKFSSPLQIVTMLLNLTTHRTKSAAGRACNPSLLTISTSLRMQFKVVARPNLSRYPSRVKLFPVEKTSYTNSLAVISPTTTSSNDSVVC
jgi:hypothetical protein